jgi:hypothetical protein
MRRLAVVILVSAMPVAARAQTIEGFWQDSARRILFDRTAPPYYAYGRWNSLDPQQTYPTAKQIRKSDQGFELIDLLYDEEEVIKVVRADANSIEFVRTSTFTGCAMHHSCVQQVDEMQCSLENSCRDVVDWRGEERYVRRANCERDGRRQAQGIPVKCR